MLLEITVKQTGFNEYAIRSENVPMPLPIDILTGSGKSP
jgi:tryptophanase